MYWWAVIHDRPVVWACDASNWPSEFVRRQLPSQPTMSRRLRTAAVARLFLAVEKTLLTLSTVAPLVLAIDGKPLPVAWALSSLNVREPRMGVKLVNALTGHGYLLGDSQYDANYLYDAAAAADYQLLAPQQRPGRGLGRRRHSPHRLRGLELLRTNFGRNLYRRRLAIERCVAQLTSFVGGLAPLPFWVRRFSRVKLWGHSKLLIHAVHQLKLRERAASC